MCGSSRLTGHMTHGAMWSRHMGCVWPRIAEYCSSPLLQTTSAADITSPEPHMVSSPGQTQTVSCNSFLRNSVITLSSEWSQDLECLECECHHGVMGRAESGAKCCQGGMCVCLCPGQLRSRALPSPGPAVTPALLREHLRQLAGTAATIPHRAPAPGTKQYFANN